MNIKILILIKLALTLVYLINPPVSKSDPLMSPTIKIDGAGSEGLYPDAAYNEVSNQYLVVWTDGAKGVRGRIVRSGKTFGEEFGISTVGKSDGDAHVTFDSSRMRYFVVWRRGSDGNRMYGRFVPWDGPNAGLSEFILEPLEESAGGYDVRYNNTEDDFFVVWDTEYTTPSLYYPTVGRAVPADGNNAIASTIPIANSPPENRSWPGVAFNPIRNEYLVTTHDYPKINDNVYGVLVTGKAVVKSEFTIAGWPDEEAWPAVAACPTLDQYLVVWNSFHVSEPWVGNIPPGGVFARYITGSGVLGSVKEVKHWDSLSEPAFPDVACGMTNLLYENPRYLAVFTSSGHSGGTIQGRMIFSNETLGAAFDIGTGYRQSVAGGRINFLVVWNASGWPALSGGVFARFVGNTRPEACISVTPVEGDIQTSFTFDASCSWDATQPSSVLQARWDWEGDGTYDTPWSTQKKISHKFTLPPVETKSVFTVKVEVTDGKGETDWTATNVTVHSEPYDPGEFYIIKNKEGKTAIIYLR